MLIISVKISLHKDLFEKKRICHHWTISLYTPQFTLFYHNDILDNTKQMLYCHSDLPARKNTDDISIILISL